MTTTFLSDFFLKKPKTEILHEYQPAFPSNNILNFTGATDLSCSYPVLILYCKTLIVLAPLANLLPLRIRYCL